MAGIIRPGRLVDGRARLARPARFVAVGLVSSAVQLGCLATLVQLGAGHDPANVVALLTAAQVNFLLSAAVIWPDRPTSIREPDRLPQRLVAFNAMSATTMLINEGVFAASVHVVPYLLAGVAGIGVAAPINYVVGHYLIFHRREGDDEDGAQPVGGRRLAGLQ